MPDAVVLTSAPDAMDRLIALLWRDGWTVLGPVLGEGAVEWSEVRGVADLPRGVVDAQAPGSYRLDDDGSPRLFGWAVGPWSPRRHLVPPRRAVWTAVRRHDGFDVLEPDASAPPTALVGVRACDLAAMAVQDRVLDTGAHPDRDHQARRAATLLVAVGCARPAATCFCSSMGTGPGLTAGFDLGLTELVDGGGHRLVARAGSDRGAELLTGLLAGGVAWRPVTDADEGDVAAQAREAAAAQVRRLDPVAARTVLAGAADHPHWDAVAERCLSCTSCTLVCPTCFCTSLGDEVALDAGSTERVQRWASCFALEHSYLHGSGSVRADVRSRYRQWLTHKLSTWWDQFGQSGCVGCGRCITWCPAGIDLTEEVRSLAGGTP